MLATPFTFTINYALVPKVSVWHVSLHQANLGQSGEVTNEVNANYANWKNRFWLCLQVEFFHYTLVPESKQNVQRRESLTG